ncbi:2-oxoglutarate dehydrogenase, E2 component, dihydrolipoamide succinyltransferase [Mycolicibacterium boenickei]|uniref:2-oxoglutarate dehydrogenase, E2 component, dihydrolipoamide succinyltransferase n=1 Tax=Mycolicibacterium boenickei TaxID=146017 RepID=UPI00098A0F3D|nr:2-oxoglutarate dehydrogenase, E2 component, dihydrolipoamide succinyltransferase [Mycolicibacterium boenickei]
MAISVQMPALGESVTEGTVTRWLKQEGDTVELDEPLLEVSTDKVDTEIPSPAAGVLTKIVAQEDDTVEIGGELAVIGEAGEQAEAAPAPEAKPEPEPEPQATAPSAAPAETAAPEPAAPAQPAPAAPAPAAASGSATTVVMPELGESVTEGTVTRWLKKVGDSVGVDEPLVEVSTDKVDTEIPSPVAGTLLEITAQEDDTVAVGGELAKIGDASAAPAAAPAALAHLRGTTQKANRIRQITAKKTRESLQATAQLTQTHEVDMTKIVALRARAKADFAEREGVNLTYLPFIARAVIDALKIHPNVNASYNEDTKEITYYDAEHLGFAVDTEQGLLSPVIHNAGDLSLGGLARAISDIAARARSGNLKPDELSGGTFTITNIGSQGALFDTPILVPPQAAMLGTGAIVKRPRVISDAYGNESIGVRSVCYLPLTYDHRLIDGADAGRFVTTIKRRLEEGAFEADLGL